MLAGGLLERPSLALLMPSARAPQGQERMNTSWEEPGLPAASSLGG